MREEAISLRRQIADLQQEARMRDVTTNALPQGVSSQSSSSPLPALPLAFMTSNEHPVMSRSLRHLCPLQYVFTAFDLQDVDCSNSLDHPNLQPWATAHDISSHPNHIDLLPTMEEVRRTIQALAEASKHGPSNLDKIVSLPQLREDCRLVYSPDGLESPQYAGSRFRCFVTVYLAMSMTGAVNAEDVTTSPRALACLAKGFRELPSLIEKPDFVS